jgi:glycosyltransferase involved in cell wall biosynthesis
MLTFLRMSNPKVSVLLPARNAAAHLGTSLDSILKQYLSDFEIILITQDSSDATKEIAEHYSKVDSRILHIEDPNLGVGSALNLGVKAAAGEYLLRQDADDISLPNRFLAQVSYMDKFSEIDVLGSGMKTIGRAEMIWKMPLNHDEIIVQFLARSSLLHPTICIKGSFARAHNILYSEIPNTAEDFDLWVRLMKTATFANLDLTTVLYRIHSNQITQKKPDEIWDSTSRVRNRLLELTVPDLVPSDIELHENFVRGNSEIDTQQLSQWFKKIFESNKETQVFSYNALSRFFDNEMVHALAREKNNSLEKPLRSNLIAGLVRSIPIPIRSRLKSFLD